MATTIQLTEQTKEDLLNIKTRLEQQTGEKYTLEDAIRWLIARSKRNSFEERKNIAKKLFGSIKDLNITSDYLKSIFLKYIIKSSILLLKKILIGIPIILRY